MHRDVKLANILLSDDPEPRRVLLTDFGTAISPGFATVTMTGLLVGTPHYLAPERVKGERGGPAADQYALGVLLYRLAAGVPPFDAPDVFAILALHQSGSIPRLRQLVPEVSPDLERIISRMLAAEPHQRFPDLSAVAQALAEHPRILADLPEQTTSWHGVLAPRLSWRAALVVPVALLAFGAGVLLANRANAGPPPVAQAMSEATSTRARTTPVPTFTLSPSLTPAPSIAPTEAGIVSEARGSPPGQNTGHQTPPVAQPVPQRLALRTWLQNHDPPGHPKPKPPNRPKR